MFLSNRTSTTSLPNNRTPFESWHYRTPSVHHLRVFGCQVFIHKRKEVRESKYLPISSEGILLGFTEDKFNYRVYNLSTRKTVVSHDVTFHENVFPFRKIYNNPDLPSDWLTVTSPPSTQSSCTQHNPNPVSTPSVKVTPTEFDEPVGVEATGEMTSPPEAEHSGDMPVPVVDCQARGEMTDQVGGDAESCDDDNAVNPPPGMPPEIRLNNQPHSKPPPTHPPAPEARQASRNVGNRKSYKGMTADFTSNSLGACFDVLPAQCCGAVITEDNPKSFKKAM